MAENSKIEWTDHTLNFWLGCTAITPACDNCYARAWARRIGRPELWEGERSETTLANRHKAHKWNREAAAAGRRQRVFTNSLADFFDNQVPRQWRREAWQIIEETPNLDWMILTKRPQNIAKMLPDPETGASAWGEGWRHVWMGTTVEDRKRTENIEHLRRVPAAGVPFFFKQWGNWREVDGPKTLSCHRASSLGTHWLMRDGQMVERRSEKARFIGPYGDYLVANFGKKAAGRLLDGVEHNGMPEARS